MNSARRSGAFEITIFDENGKLVDSTSRAGSSAYTITTKPDALQSVILTNSNKTVGGYGRLTVTLITRHGISGNDDIEIAFPKWDANAPASAAGESYLKDSKCKVVSASPSASCTVTNLAESDVVKVSDAFSRSIAAGVPAVLHIEYVRNAGSLRGVNTIKVSTLTSSG